MTGGRPRDEFERELFEKLPDLKRFAYNLTRDMTRAEDLYSDVLLRLWANKDKYVIGSNMKAWSFFIMRNTFLSERRRAWRWQPWNDLFDTTLPAKDDSHMALELKEVLTSMSFLNPEHAEAIMMIAEGMTYEEAAEEMGVEVGTVKSRVGRGREALEKLFAA